jgi:hypothetical protein
MITALSVEFTRAADRITTSVKTPEMLKNLPIAMYNPPVNINFGVRTSYRVSPLLPWGANAPRLSEGRAA